MLGFRALRCMSALVVLFTLSISSLTAFAQSASEFLINYVEAFETDDGLELAVYFTLVDPSGRAVPNAAIRSASVLIDEGNPTRYEASAETSDASLFITLVLDASGSMLGAASDMRAAAMQAVNDAPPRAQFAVIGFNDEITLMTEEFTADKAAVIDAIQRVQAMNNRGTCLYDATYQAIELLVEAAPLGQRAAIVFTDGVDEVLTPTPGPCSEHTTGDVIELATRRDLRVPVHTIGMRGGQAQINPADLRTIASETGGLSAIGAQSDLADLFRTSMEAIGSQQRVTTVVHPTAGERTLTLLVTLTDGTPLRAVGMFNSPEDYSIPFVTATPDLTATPRPVGLEILGVRPIVEDRTIVLQTNVENEEIVSTYRIELKDASTNTLQGDGALMPPPLPSSVPLEVGALPGGEYEVAIRALDANGRVIASSGEERFVYFLPTPVPSPTVPTDTPVPLGARIQSVQHNLDEKVLWIYMSVYGAENIAHVRIELKDASTNQLIGVPQTSDPVEMAEISAAMLVGGDYEVAVVSLDEAGNELARDVYKFGVTPPTATPTLTPTPTPTVTPTHVTDTPAPLVQIRSVQHQQEDNTFRLNLALFGADQIAQLRIELFDQQTRQLIGIPFFATPAETAEITAGDLVDGSYEVVVVALDANGGELGRSVYQFGIRQPTPTPEPTAVAVVAEIQFPQVDESTLEMIFPVSTQNVEGIAEYVLEFIDRDNILAYSTSLNPPPYEELRVSLVDLGIQDGEYVIQLKVLAGDGTQLSQSSLPPVFIRIPELPSTPGPSPVPAPPAAFPSLEWARENQYIALGVIGGLILLLLIALVAVTRRSKAAPRPLFYEELSSAQQIPEIEPNYQPGPMELDPDATNPFVQTDPDATNPIPQMILPDARLVVERSRAAPLVGQAIPVSHVPFKLGRRGRGDISFDGDDNVSREHAIIRFDNGEFTLTDLGSMHGTAVNGERISSNSAVPLRNGDQIRFGITTQIVFETEK